MTNERWKANYISYLHDGKLGNANKVKRENMPSKLYRFERVEDNRLITLRNNQLYVSLQRDLMTHMMQKGSLTVNY